MHSVSLVSLEGGYGQEKTHERSKKQNSEQANLEGMNIILNKVLKS
jgi:hypothetical protein